MLQLLLRRVLAGYDLSEYGWIHGADHERRRRLVEVHVALRWRARVRCVELAVDFEPPGADLPELLCLGMAKLLSTASHLHQNLHGFQVLATGYEPIRRDLQLSTF